MGGLLSYAAAQINLPSPGPRLVQPLVPTLLLVRGERRGGGIFCLTLLLLVVLSPDLLLSATRSGITGAFKLSVVTGRLGIETGAGHHPARWPTGGPGRGRSVLGKQF